MNRLVSTSKSLFYCFILLFPFFLACSSNEESKNSLFQADSLMGIRPDSAPALLNAHPMELYTKQLILDQKKREKRIILISCGVLCTSIFIFIAFGIRQRKKIIKLQKKHINEQVDPFMTPSELNEPSELNGKVRTIKMQQKEQCDKNRCACVQVFKDKEEYNNLLKLIQEVETNDQSIPYQKRKEIQQSIYLAFFDVMADLRKLYDLTTDDAYFCILSSFDFSNKTVAILLGVSTDAIKSRKSRIKGKIDFRYFQYIFSDKTLKISE